MTEPFPKEMFEALQKQQDISVLLIKSFGFSEQQWSDCAKHSPRRQMWDMMAFPDQRDWNPAYRVSAGAITVYCDNYLEGNRLTVEQRVAW